MPFRLVRTSAAQALAEVEKLLKSMPACVQARLRFAAKPWAKLAMGAATGSVAGSQASWLLLGKLGATRTQVETTKMSLAAPETVGARLPTLRRLARN